MIYWCVDNGDHVITLTLHIILSKPQINLKYLVIKDQQRNFPMVEPDLLKLPCT